MARRQKLYSKYDKRHKRRRGPRQSPFLLGLSFVVAFCIGFFFTQFDNGTFVDLNNEYKSEALAAAIIQEAKREEAQRNQTLGMMGEEILPKMDHGNIKFLIFHRMVEAQGQGNHLHGLLAAHLLADEFNRVVCVSDHYKDFHLAFQHADPIAIEHCPDILRRHNNEPPNTQKEATIELLNYHTTNPPNECKLKELLESSKRVLHITANTYPRWPRVPTHLQFLKLYQPKEILLDVLPYPRNEPPPIVVHLRQADKEGGDQRKGVDNNSLKALGGLLPLDASQHSPFLVTNNVQWFDYFEKHHGWSHPYWQIVMHSALGFQWEGRLLPQSGTTTSRGQPLLQQKYGRLRQEIGVDAWETLQLFSDWYTLLRAEKVYHTYSDFSLSAVHWMNTWSRTYDGLDRHGKPILLQENWIVDGESPRLVDRTGDALRNCNARHRGF